MFDRDSGLEGSKDCYATDSKVVSTPGVARCVQMKR